MKVVHKFGNKNCEKEVNENLTISLSNKIGGFYYDSLHEKTKYDGIYFRLHKHGSLVKVVEEIKNKDEVIEVVNELSLVEKKYKDYSEKYFFPHDLNAFVYETDKEHEIYLILDVHKFKDYRTFGKFYTAYEKDNKLVIEFIKKTDKREDESDNEEEYKVYTVLLMDDLNYTIDNKWFEKKYPQDARRGSLPDSRWVYDCLKLKCKKLVVSVSEDLDEALEKSMFVYKEADYLKKEQNDILKKRFAISVKDKELDLAYKCAVRSIDDLLVTHYDLGIYAGLPWFAEFWSRDQNISLKILMLTNHMEIVKPIIINELDEILSDGRIPNILNKYDHKGSADGIGWLFLRVSDFLELCNQNLLTINQRINIMVKVSKAIERLENYWVKDGLTYNHLKETWMDTTPPDEHDVRDGARIEIQALTLTMYKLMYKLSGDESWNNKIEKTKKIVVDKFWNHTILADGVDDFTIRPNIFIAAYVFEDLLPKLIWKKAIDNALEKLWLDWGGLSTIDKDNKMFKDTYSGELPISYHRGDSWYWINNLAAIVMHRIDKNHYKDKISKILEASSQEILWQGCIGSASELSSAKKRESQGCLNQAWSNATFIELIHQIYDQ